MSWIDKGVLIADRRDWQFSQPIESNLIKIENSVTHRSISSNITNFKGLISLSFDKSLFFDDKEIFSIPKSQLIIFQDFNINLDRHIAIRNISRSFNNNQWLVKVYSWDVVINPYIPNISVKDVSLSDGSIAEINKQKVSNEEEIIRTEFLL